MTRSTKLWQYSLMFAIWLLLFGGSDPTTHTVSLWVALGSMLWWVLDLATRKE